MKAEEAIKILDDGDWWDYLDDYIPEEIRNKLVEAIDIADAALHVQQETEKNDPLTLDELDQMEGQPIWCIPLCPPPKSGYGHIEHGVVELAIPSEWRLMCYREDYGKTWLAYRSKPKEG